MTKLIKPVEKKQVSRPNSNCNSFMSQALSQVKISMPLLEVMKFPDYKNETLKIISNVGEMSREDPKSKEDPPVVYLGTSVTKTLTQVDPFYLTLLINEKMLKTCMIDSGAAINIMLEDVMKELRMHVDTPYNKCYAMDNRSVLVVGIMKDIEFIFSACPNTAYKTDITVVQVPANYGMLLSR